MTEQEQRIAIYIVFHPETTSILSDLAFNGTRWGICPNYPNDANTRKEMLAKLTIDQQAELIRNRTGLYSNPGQKLASLLNMDQPEFCKLWLKVLGKWKEGA